MKKIILVVLMTTFLSLNALEPVVKVPPKTEIKGGPLFWSEYARVFTSAEALKNQLELLDEKPIATFPTIPDNIAGVAQLQYDQYENLYEKAKILEQQIMSLPENILREKYLQQKDSIKILDRRLFLAESEKFLLERDSQRYQLIKEQEEFLRNEISSLQNKLDSLNHVYFKKYIEARNILNDINNDMLAYTTQVLTVSGSANFFTFRDDALDTDISPGVMLTFNPSTILGFGSVVDVYAQFITPYVQNDPEGIDFRTNFYNFGVNLNLPITDVLNIKDFRSNFKVGGGFFWASTQMWNGPVTDTDWNGQALRLELNFLNNNVQFPLEVYFSYSFYNVVDDLTYRTTTDIIDLGDNLWINNFEIGTRFTLWRTECLLP